tara:strand:- start:681 stop:1487 length:807 start_codon:yes stop_codon:yes gene_type:complete
MRSKSKPLKNRPLLHFETYKNTGKEWILFIHGAGGSTRTWKRQIDSFKKDFQLLLIDLPGHGQNANKEAHLSEYSFSSISNEIWKIVDHLKISKVHLLGVSLGAIFCLQMRAIRPHCVKSIAMPGAIVRLNMKLKALASFSLSLAKIIGYRNLYNMSAYIMMPRENHKKSRDVFVKESKVLTTEEFRKWTALYYNLNTTLTSLFNDSSAIPHLLVMGSQDHLFLPPAKDYTHYHNNADLIVIDKCGHVVSIEKAEYFNSIYLNFLKSV